MYEVLFSNDNLLEQLSFLAGKKFKKEEFQQFIISINNGIILGQRRDNQLFLVLAEPNSEIGLLKWEMTPLKIHEKG